MSRLSREGEPMNSVAEEGSSLLRSQPTKRHLFNATLLSVGFFLLFSAYNGTSNLLTSGRDPNIGYIANAIVYAFFAFGALFVSTGVLTNLGPKWSIPLGALAYTIFQATNLKGQEWWKFLWSAAGVLGIGASILWSAQGSYITIAAKNHAVSRGLEKDASQGMFQGLFFGILQVNQIVGNLCAGFIFLYAASGADILMKVYLGLSVVGLIVLCLLPNERDESAEEESAPSVLERILSVIRLHTDKKVILMIPIMFYTGMEQGFLIGDLTKAIGKSVKSDTNENYGKAWIGFSMTLFGIVAALCSVLFGRLVKNYTKFVLGMGALAHSSLFAFVIYATQKPGGMESIFSRNMWAIFMCTAAAGMADAVWNVVPATLIGSMFPENSKAAFSTLKLWGALGAFTILMIGDHSPLLWKTIYVAIELFLSVTGVLVLQFLLKREQYIIIDQ